MNLGVNMSLKTRLDGRSSDNNRFCIRDTKGDLIAEIKLADMNSATIEIKTEPSLELYIDKPTGWSSAK